MIVSVVLFGSLIGTVTQVQHAAARSKEKKRVLNRTLDKDLVLSLDHSGDGKLDKSEFALGMLLQLGVITEEDVTPFFARSTAHRHPRPQLSARTLVAGHDLTLTLIFTLARILIAGSMSSTLTAPAPSTRPTSRRTTPTRSPSRRRRSRRRMTSCARSIPGARASLSARGSDASTSYGPPPSVLRCWPAASSAPSQSDTRWASNSTPIAFATPRC